MSFICKWYTFRKVVISFLTVLLLPAALLAQTYVFKSKFGTPGTGDGEFFFPGAVAVAPNGDIVVADTENHRIQVFDSSGTFKLKFGSFGTDLGQFKSPAGVAVASNGDIAVSELIFKNFLSLFNSAGVSLGGFPPSFSSSPEGVAFDSSDFAIVADTANDRIQGGNISPFGGPGSGNGQFPRPSDVAIAANGDIIVADTLNSRIQIFDGAGTFKSKFGSVGNGDGELRSPEGVAVAPSGYIVVADTDNERIQIFDSEGTFKSAFGSAGSGDGEFHLPEGVAVAPNGDIVVADTGNFRVQIFEEVRIPNVVIKKVVTDEVEIEWLSQAGVTYQIQISDDLSTWTDSGAPIAGDGNEISRSFSTVGLTRQFFRIVVTSP